MQRRPGWNVLCFMYSCSGWLRITSFSSIEAEKHIPWILDLLSSSKDVPVERKVFALLPDKLDVNFYGSAGVDKQYVIIFTIFPSHLPCDYETLLNALSPMWKGIPWTLKSIRVCAVCIYTLKKRWDNFIALIRHCCSVNKALAQRMRPFFIFYWVQKLMQKLSNQIPLSGLRQHKFWRHSLTMRIDRA